MRAHWLIAALALVVGAPALAQSTLSPAATAILDGNLPMFNPPESTDETNPTREWWAQGGGRAEVAAQIRGACLPGRGHARLQPNTW